jgi:PKD repeat protein
MTRRCTLTAQFGNVNLSLLWPAAIALLLLGGLWMLFGLTRPAAADGPWYVDAATGDDGNDCLSPASACATVGAAVDLAVSGDTIYIAAGTYSETITLIQSAELIGAGADQTVLTTGNEAVITVDDGETTTFNARLEGMTIADAKEYAGGIVNHENLVVTGTVVQNNHYFGIWNYAAGTLDVSESTLRGNGDIALFNNGGTVTLNDVTITDNSGNSVVHTQNDGDSTLTNVTISGNVGKAVVTASGASATLFNSTIANNMDGGVSNSSGDTLTLQNTILASNGSYNCWTAVTSLGHNMADDDTCSLDGDGDLTNTDPLLEPLDDNGGPTLTHALSASSPAIDAGDNAACPAADQRGQMRPVDGDNDATADCDIGAFEYAESAVVSVEISAPATALPETSVTFSATISPDTANRPITYTWTADGQTTVTHTVTSSTDYVTFTWDSLGTRNVSVTAANSLGQSSDSVQINIQEGVQAVTGVAISGPTTGNAGETYTFTAQASPSDATLPVTYTWQIDEQAPVTHVGDISHQLALSWPDAGTYTLAVTATNAGGSAADSHTVALTAWYVAAENGDDGNDCQTPSTACRTIQSTLDRAPAEAHINIAAGVYSESVTIDQSAQLFGAGPGQSVLTTGDGPVVTVDNGQTARFEARLKGMTIEEGPGGGIVNREALIVTGSVIQNNGSYGIHNYGVLEVSKSTIRGNMAGSATALMNRGGVATLNGVTISGNVSDNSIVHTQGDGGNTSLTNVTVSGNDTGDGTGTAVTSASGAAVTVLNSTIANNSGGGVSNYGTLVTLQNTLLAGNGGDNCWTAVTSQGHNLEDGDTCALDGDGDQSNADPLLRPLLDNGGETLTHLPGPGSPAVDAADNAACPATDQRGETRPFDGDGDETAVCDVGAVEVTTVKSYQIFIPAAIR